MVNCGFPDSLGEHTGPAEIGLKVEQSIVGLKFSLIAHPNFRLQLRRAFRKILASLDSLFHLPVDCHPIGTSEHRAGAKESQRVVFSASAVDGNIPKHVFVDLLGEIDVDAEEVG